MGIFDKLVYSEKDYATNTKLIKQRIEEFIPKASKPEGIRKLLSTIMLTADLTEFPTARTAKVKDQKAIDERIFNIIDAMQEDLQKGRHIRFQSHAKMLQTAITVYRAFGVEGNQKDLETEEIMLQCESVIYEALLRKTDLSKEKKAILDKAEGETNENEVARLENEYNKLVAEEEGIDENIAAYTEIYNGNLEAKNVRARVNNGVQLQKMSIVTSLSEFNREVELGVQLFEKAHAHNVEIIEAARDAKKSVAGMHKGTSSNSDFRANLEGRKNAAMKEMVENSTPGEEAEPAKPKSAFRDAMNQK